MTVTGKLTQQNLAQTMPVHADPLRFDKAKAPRACNKKMDRTPARASRIVFAFAVRPTSRQGEKVYASL